MVAGTQPGRRACLRIESRIHHGAPAKRLMRNRVLLASLPRRSARPRGHWVGVIANWHPERAGGRSEVGALGSVIWMGVTAGTVSCENAPVLRIPSLPRRVRPGLRASSKSPRATSDEGFPLLAPGEPRSSARSFLRSTSFNSCAWALDTPCSEAILRGNVSAPLGPLRRSVGKAVRSPQATTALSLAHLLKPFPAGCFRLVFGLIPPCLSRAGIGAP